MRTPLPVCAFVLAALACGSDHEPLDGFRLPAFEVVVAAQTSGGCDPTSNGNADFPADVDRLLLKLRGQTADGAPIAFDATVQRTDLGEKAEVLVTGVPPGDDLTLDLFGCSAGGSVAWSARVKELDVKASEKIAPRLYFTKKETFSCTGHTKKDELTAHTPSMQNPRFLHRSVITYQGRLLVVGGFNKYDKGAGVETEPPGKSLTSIAVYRPSVGLFYPFGPQLETSRGMHHLVPFDGRRKVLVIGGMTRARLAPSPPIEPDWTKDGAIPASDELIDIPGRKVEKSKLGFVPLPLSALAHAQNGLSIVLTGGMATSDKRASAELQWVSDNAAKLANGGAQVVRRGVGGQTDGLVVPRMTHTATWFGGDAPGAGKVLIVGGNFDGNPANLLELLSGADFQAQAVAMDDPQTKPFGMHETAHVRSDGCKDYFLVAGGMGITTKSGGAPDWEPPQAGGARLLMVELDQCEGAPKGKVDDWSGILEKPAQMKRVFHEMTALEEGLVMISGGYSVPSGGADDATYCDPVTLAAGCYLPDVVVLRAGGTTLEVVPPAGERSFSKREDASGASARLGHDVALLPDGTALVTGGLLAIDKNDTTNVRNDAEIFNPLTKSQEGLCKQ